MKIYHTLKKYKTAFLAILSVALLYLVFYLTGIGCPIKFLTGISCPGCGMTRACFSAFIFKFDRAFYFHPLWVAVIPSAILLIFLKVKKQNKAFWITVFVLCSALVITYFIRLFSSNPIVVFNPKDSILYKIFKKIFK